MLEADPARVRAALLVWDIGINDPDGPSPMIETVTRTTVGDRPIWRVAHYPADPSEESEISFDVFDVDAETIAPLRSTWQNLPNTCELTFAADQVRLRRSDGTEVSTETVPLSGPVWPEGPGMKVFLGALPLEIGYRTAYQIVDRWDGHEASRVKTLNLSVVGKERLATRAGPQEVLEVHVEPLDGSFSMRSLVRAKAPHYPWRTEYERGPLRLISEVRAMALD